MLLAHAYETEGEIQYVQSFIEAFVDERPPKYAKLQLLVGLC